MSTAKPLPSPDPLTAPYWAAALEGRFELPRCEDCGEFHFYPRAVCPGCGSARIGWVRATGRGEVYTYSVIYRAPSAAFAGDVPYVVAIVALEEGPHLMANIDDCAPGAVRIGMKVRVAFRRPAEDVALPVFVPA